MKFRICGPLMILLVAFATAETEDQPQNDTPIEVVEPNAEVSEIQAKGDTGELDSLRPGNLKKRSISNIIKLLLGGNVPPNHPLVKSQSEPKIWSLASNILAATPGSGGYGAGGGGLGGGWGRISAGEQLANLFATKAKILPYTGQVASGLTGIASVKGDILKQIHSLSTAVIAQAAAEAAAKAVASAAAAHAVTNSVANAINAKAHIKAEAVHNVAHAHAALAHAGHGHSHGHSHAGHAHSSLGHSHAGLAHAGGYGNADYHQAYYSTNQNAYASPAEGKTPVEQPGPPYYPAASAATQSQQQYQSQPSTAYQNAYASPATNNYAPAPQSASNYQSPAAYPVQTTYQAQQAAYQSQLAAYQSAAQSVQASQQTQYQPTPAVAQTPYNLYGSYAAARSTPGESHLASASEYSTLPQRYEQPQQQQQNQRPHGQQGYTSPIMSLPGGTKVQGYNPLSIATNPARLLTSSTDVRADYLPFQSFHSAASAGVSGRNAKQPSSPPSILSSLATLISASTTAYNALNRAANPAASSRGSSSDYSGSVPDVSASDPSPFFSKPQSSSASGQHQSFGQQQQQQQQQLFGQNPSFHQQQQQHQSVSGPSGQQPTGPNSFNSRPQFGSASAQQPIYTQTTDHRGQQQQAYPTSFNSPSSSFSPQSYPNSAPQYSPQTAGNPFNANSISRTPFSGQQQPGHGHGHFGYNGGAGSSVGHAGGFSPQPAGPSAYETGRPSGNGYSSQTTGNFNSPSGAFGPQQSPSEHRPQNFPVHGQANYPSSQNAYSSSYGQQTQQQTGSPYNAPPQFNGPSPVGPEAKGVSGYGNPYLTSPSEQINRIELPSQQQQQQSSHSQSQSQYLIGRPAQQAASQQSYTPKLKGEIKKSKKAEEELDLKKN